MESVKQDPVCLICLRLFKIDDNEQSNRVHLFTSTTTGPENGKLVGTFGSDVYLRFLNFTRKYLGLESSGSDLLCEAKAKKKAVGEDVKAFCKKCQSIVGLICDLYTELQAVKLRLLWRLDQLGEEIAIRNKALSPKLKNKMFGLLKTQMNVRAAFVVDDFRKRILLKCKYKARKGCGPIVSLHRGLDPEEWKFTYSATKEALMRLIIIIAFGSSHISCKQPRSKSNQDYKSKELDSNFSPLEPEFDGIDDVIENACEATNESVRHHTVDTDQGDSVDFGPPSPVFDFDNDAELNLSSESEEAGDFKTPLPLRKSGKRPPTRKSGRKRATRVKEECTSNDDDADSDSDWCPEQKNKTHVKVENWDEEESEKDSVKVEGDAENVEDLGSKIQTKRGRKKKSPDSRPVSRKDFHCPHPNCGKQFTKEGHLNRHLRLVHKQKTPCPQCGMKFATMSELRLHWRRFHRAYKRPTHKRLPVKPQQDSISKRRCRECSLSFDTLNQLLLHRRKTHKMEFVKHVCPICFRNVMSKERLEKHVLRHERNTIRDVKIYYCDVCTKHFYTENSLIEHIELDHHDQYECFQCNAHLSSAKELRDHLEAIHEANKDDPMFHCPYCFRGFNTQQYFDIHRKIVHDKNRFLCDKIGCTEELSSNEELVQHIKSHLVLEKNEDAQAGMVFNCSICGRGFVEKYNMTLHELTHIPPSTTSNIKYECPVCRCGVQSVSNLISHYNTNHGLNLRPYPCNQCELSFQTKKYQQRHIKFSHKDGNFCELCGKLFERAYRLKQHILRVHEGIKPSIPYKPKVPTLFTNFKCDQPGCEMNFPSKKRLRTHKAKEHGVGDLFPCNICGSLFVGKKEVQTHISSRHEEPKFECEICHKKFTRKAPWVLHTKCAHDPDRKPSHVCPHCGKAYKCKSGLEFHMGEKHLDENQKRFSCTKCGRKYHRKQVYDQHEKNCKNYILRKTESEPEQKPTSQELQY